MSIRDLIIGITLMLLWGINFSVIKLGVEEVNPLVLTAFRFLFAVFPMIFFIPRPNVPYKYLVGYGLTFGIGVWGLTTCSIHIGLSAGVSSLILETSFLFSMIFGWLVLKEKPRVVAWIGALIALLGLGLTLLIQDGSFTLTGALLATLGAFFWGVSSLVVKIAKPQEVFAFNIWGMLFIPAPLLILSIVLSGSEVITELPETLNGSAWFSILFQAYPTTLLGYWVWNRLQVKYPLNVVSPLLLLVPIFSLFGSAVFYGEQITVEKTLACLLITVGVLVSQLKVDLWISSVRFLKNVAGKKLN